MSTSCDLVAEDMGAGVAAAMTAVDCIASEVSEEAFLRLSEGPMGTVLPILLTFFVAFFGISLVLGRSNLSLRGVIPKMVTIGLVTAFATSFVIFQQLSLETLRASFLSYPHLLSQLWNVIASRLRV